MLKDFQNIISYCERCSSTLYWNNNGEPSILNFGNKDKDMKTCLEKGCLLIYVKTPREFAGPNEMELLRLALVRAGMGEEEAAMTVANLSYDPLRLAA
jgi:hypothetical protein